MRKFVGIKGILRIIETSQKSSAWEMHERVLILRHCSTDLLIWHEFVEVCGCAGSQIFSGFQSVLF